MSGTVEVRALLRLGIPAAFTQLGLMLLHVVDTIMVGHVGVHELDAAALGGLVGMGTVIFGHGFVLGMDPVATQAHGAGDGARVGRTLQRGLVIAVLASLPIMALWTLATPALRLAGQTPELSEAAGEYLAIQVVSVAPYLAFQAQRQYLQARGIVAPGLWVVAAANVVNVLANWILIFGHFGVPPLGLAGAAIATAGSRIFQCVALAAWIWVRRLHEGAWVPWSTAALDRQGLREILHHGVPIGIQYGLEMWAFQSTTLLAGLLGATALAAHVIALNVASVSFMFSLGIAIAGTVRVGNLIGAGRPRDAQHAAWVAMGVAIAIMSSAAVVFALARELIPRAYSSDPAVIATAATLLPIAAAFQIFDGTQVVGGGVLRGMGRTRPAAVFNLVGYYLLGLPLACLLAFAADVGVTGLWWGMVVGLAVVALSLVGYIKRHGPAHLAPEQE